MEWVIIIGLGLVVYAIASREKDEPQYMDDDEDLAGFRITVSRSSGYSREPPSKNKKPGIWKSPGEAIKVGSYEISGGYFYVGGQLDALDGYGTESSLVDPTLKVNSKSPDYSGEGMGYWPSYSSISPKSRAAYIEWLAGNRSDEDCYIGYVFLYFYGIERRLLVDGQKDKISSDEVNALVVEINRLIEVYGDNRSFQNYASNLLAHVWVLYGLANPDQSLLTSKRNFTSVFKNILGKTVSTGNPVSGALALAWVKSHPEFSLRTPARRCEKEFNQLFKLRYRDKFDKGLVIKPNKTKVHLDYAPASGSLRGYQSIELDLPDVSKLKAPVKKLFAVAESCVDELEAYSRFVGKPENDRNSLASIAYLPKVLTGKIDHPKFNAFQTWLSNQLTGDIAVISTEKLFEQLGDDAPLKINKKEAEMLAELFEKTGFGLAPDLRYHLSKPEINGSIAVFKGGHGDGFKPSHAFNQVGTILRLGSMVAAIDGDIDASEISLLENLVNDDSQLAPAEKSSLKAYLHWRLSTKVNMNGLKARLASISDREKSAVSHILVSVALADGTVDPTEIKQLEKLYTALGLDKSMVTSDIHQLTTKRSKGGAASTTESSYINGVSFSLDRDLLKVHEEETEGVKAVLETIFADDIPDEPEETLASQSHFQVHDLDEKHAKLYNELVSKGEWSSDEVGNLCKELNLMLEGALEVINDWAYELVESQLIDNGSSVYVDLELVEEIKAL